MKKNIKGVGRWARGLAGVIIIAIGWHYQSWWGAVGLFPIGEAIFSWCVILHFWGSESCKKD